MKLETAFSIDTSSIKYGPGVSEEAGYELNRLGSKRVMVLTDHNVSKTEIFQNVIRSIKNSKIDISSEQKTEIISKKFSKYLKK